MNFGQLIEAVRLRCGISASDARMTAYIKSMINVEYARLCAEHHLLQKTGTLALVANSNVVDLPNDWQRTHQIRTATYILEPVTPFGYAAAQATGYSGRYIYTGQSPERINILPVPDKSEAQGLTILYAASPETLVNDADEPYVIPHAYRNVLSSLASYHVLVAEESLDLAQAANTDAATIEARLSANSVQKDGEGMNRIVPPPALVGR